MHLLQSSVDMSVTALWLGQESPATRHIDLEADLAMKERALGRPQPPAKAGTRYGRPTD
jgi:integrase/recombinase XerD